MTRCAQTPAIVQCTVRAVITGLRIKGQLPRTTGGGWRDRPEHLTHLDMFFFSCSSSFFVLCIIGFCGMKGEIELILTLLYLYYTVLY